LKLCVFTLLKKGFTENSQQVFIPENDAENFFDFSTKDTKQHTM